MKICLKNIECVSAALFALALPLQTRVLLFEAPYASEWSNAFLYASDIALFALLGVFGARVVAKQAKVQGGAVVWVIGLLVLTAFAHIAFAEYMSVAAFGALKALQGALLFVWAYSSAVSSYCVVVPLVVGSIVNALVGFFQFSFQKSVGLTFLTESPLTPYAKEVAEVVVSSGRFIRAYGLEPSPNVLAFFLILGLLFGIALFYRAYAGHTLAFVLGAFVLIMATVMSFSRGMMLAGAGVILYYFSSLIWSVKGAYRERATEALALVGICAVVLGVLFWSPLYDRFFVNIALDNAVSERVALNSVALESIQENPLGVGAKHFTVATGEEFPVHNIFLLVTAELGVVGGALFGLILIMVLFSFFQSLKHGGFSEEKLLWFSVVLFVILTGFIDHFLFTLQQGMLAFWLLVGLGMRMLRVRFFSSRLNSAK